MVLDIFCQYYLSIPPENIQKPKVFFVQKENIAQKFQVRLHKFFRPKSLETSPMFCGGGDKNLFKVRMICCTKYVPKPLTEIWIPLLNVNKSVVSCEFAHIY